jgi:hypothetical protein
MTSWERIAGVASDATSIVPEAAYWRVLRRMFGDPIHIYAGASSAGSHLARVRDANFLLHSHSRVPIKIQHRYSVYGPS